MLSWNMENNKIFSDFSNDNGKISTEVVEIKRQKVLYMHMQYGFYYNANISASIFFLFQHFYTVNIYIF